MCGIAGVLGPGGSARALIEALTHRGPDGLFVEDEPARSLAHARLSIIDLECGWQPLHAAGATVIGNGEIYNNPVARADAYLDMHPAQLHVAFTSADPDADTNRLVAAGATLVEHLKHPDGSHLVMLRDPWGLAIQLAKRATPMI